MKRFSYCIMGLAALAAVATGCSKDTEGVTWVTYYPDIALVGETYTTWNTGTPYVDPGFTATLDGKDISDQVTISTSLNYDNPQPGFYAISYQAVNADGITASSTRYVLVADASDPVAGYYYTDPSSYRNYNGLVNYGGYFEYIYPVGDGMYYVSDLLGGWYEYRAGYGASYAMTGVVAIDDAGNVDLVDSYIAGWGDGLDYMENGTFDPATSTITYEIAYVGMPFKVIMSK